MDLVLATTNMHKIREYRDLLKSFPHLELLSLVQFSHYQQPVEDGTTFAENAELKAVDAAKKLNKWVLADDSGLVVPALNGFPGVISALYAGLGATDAENRKKLLNEMSHLKNQDERSAYFECCIVIANPEGVKKIVTGRCEGHILTEPQGRNGFGYDCLFVKNEYEKTFAELDEATKNRISHRSKAFERIKVYLEMLRE